MIQNVAHTSNAATTARRAVTADPDQSRSARPQPAADNDGAVVQLASKDAPVVTGGFGLDLAYSRQLIRTSSRGQAQVISQQDERLDLEFRFATTALPRNEAGEVDLEALANTDEKNALAQALDGLASRGAHDPQALADFTKSVDDLFGEYEQDLGLKTDDLHQAKQLFVDEVKSFFAHVEEDAAQGPADAADPPPPPDAANAPKGIAPAPVKPGDTLPRAFQSLEAALASLRERLTARRQDVLTAAGDLSKVLAERTADARKAADRARGSDDDRRASARLGDTLSALKDAQARKSTKDLRDQARQRLLVSDDKLPERVARPEPAASAIDLGRAFLDRIQPA